MEAQSTHSDLTQTSDRAQGLRKASIDASAVRYMQERLGRAIRHRRRTLDLTLQDLAKACGVSFQQVHKYESGLCSLSASQLWTIAQALEIPITYFYESLRPAEVWRNPGAGMA